MKRLPLLLLICGLALCWGAARRQYIHAASPAASAPAASTAAFTSAKPGYRWEFPRDTGSHPGYKTEWWYYTGQLFDPEGRRYGYELTFFRVGLSPTPVQRASAWAASDLYFAHFAVTDPQGKRFAFREIAARGALGMAGASTESQNVWLKDWFARLEGDAHRLKADGPEWGIDLKALPVKPPALHGKNGFSQKGEGLKHASMYYSYTRMKTGGTLYQGGKAIPVTGESWMDHEFSTDSLAPNEVGWDWFSLQFANGEDLMLYRMRRKDGTADPHSGGTWVSETSEMDSLMLQDYQIEELETWTSPQTKITYPVKWRVSVPSRRLNITVTPVMPDQELTTDKTTGVTYWEGAVDIEGTLQGRPVRGHGYVELTGYGGSLAGRA